MEIRNATRVFCIDNDKVLCIEYKLNNNGYIDIPGGKIEENETEEQCAIRELKEETGLDIDKLEKKGMLKIYYPNKVYNMALFVVNVTETIVYEFEENNSYWITIDELLRKDKKFPSTYLLNEKFITSLKKGNLNLKIYCDKNHNITEVK